MPSSCPNCHQAIRWIVTARGERLPVDPLPRPGGHYTPTEGGRFVSVGPSEAVAFFPHYLSCRRSYLAPKRKRKARPQ
jgi:hypothetical protein